MKFLSSYEEMLSYNWKQDFPGVGSLFCLLIFLCFWFAFFQIISSVCIVGILCLPSLRATEYLSLCASQLFSLIIILSITVFSNHVHWRYDKPSYGRLVFLSSCKLGKLYRKEQTYCFDFVTQLGASQDLCFSAIELMEAPLWLPFFIGIDVHPNYSIGIWCIIKCKKCTD